MNSATDQMRLAWILKLINARAQLKYYAGEDNNLLAVYRFIIAVGKCMRWGIKEVKEDDLAWITPEMALIAIRKTRVFASYVWRNLVFMRSEVEMSQVEDFCADIITCRETIAAVYELTLSLYLERFDEFSKTGEELESLLIAITILDSEMKRNVLTLSVAAVTSTFKVLKELIADGKEKPWWFDDLEKAQKQLQAAATEEINRRRRIAGYMPSSLKPYD